MGYYTTFRLHIEVDAEGNKPDANREGVILKSIADRLTGTIDPDDFFRHLLTPYSDSMKWYDHEDDMKVFSKHFPSYVFRLEGEGEENEDMWVKYFCNGKIQVARPVIAYPPFDPGKLV